ncbi:hypothetical protein C8R46DRAFT_309303 [Mycena filopes]|nr:hypothetical protein C8R46DRAFT_309303 [Mycena filopes]
MYFPPELVDRFLDNLHDDRNTLATCALVSRTWTPASRYHLFSHIVLSESWRDFLQLLASPFATFTPHSVRGIAVKTHSPMAPLLNDMVPKLPQLPAVNSLYLGFLDWKEISPLTVTCLAALFGNITVLDIANVYVRDIHELAHVVSLFPRLENVALTPSFRNDVADPQVPAVPRVAAGSSGCRADLVRSLHPTRHVRGNPSLARGNEHPALSHQKPPIGHDRTGGAPRPRAPSPRAWSTTPGPRCPL